MLKDKDNPKDVPETKNKVVSSNTDKKITPAKEIKEEIPSLEEEPTHFVDKNWVKLSFGGFFTILVLISLTLYWFAPFSSMQLFVRVPQNSNFSVNSSNASLSPEMQFYPNMRYPSTNISYEINTTLCSLQKQNNMEEAFKRIENVTLLHFYPVNSSPEISVTCNDKVIPTNTSSFIVGEGGPTNITHTDKFDVIYNGEVLLLTDSNCPNPNVATHELLHALGFVHSKNPYNIMYPIHRCDQTIGQDIPDLINHLYSYPSLPDLVSENASASIKGRFIDANVTIKNEGLVIAGPSTLIISSGNSIIRTEPVSSIPVGSGITFSFVNLLAPINMNQITFNVFANFSELEKNNNKIELILKK